MGNFQVKKKLVAFFYWCDYLSEIRAFENLRHRPYGETKTPVVSRANKTPAL